MRKEGRRDGRRWEGGIRWEIKLGRRRKNGEEWEDKVVKMKEGRNGRGGGGRRGEI